MINFLKGWFKGKEKVEQKLIKSGTNVEDVRLPEAIETKLDGYIVGDYFVAINKYEIQMEGWIDSYYRIIVSLMEIGSDDDVEIGHAFINNSFRYYSEAKFFVYRAIKECEDAMQIKKSQLKPTKGSKKK